MRLSCQVGTRPHSVRRGTRGDDVSETKTFEIADGIYRFSTAVTGVGPGAFTFNQFLIDADEPMLFHLGHRHLFTAVSEAVARVIPLADPKPNTDGAEMDAFLAAITGE